MALKEKPEAEEKTVIKASGLPSGGKHSRLQFIDVKDGRIIRARPFRYDLGVPARSIYPTL